ncbi:MATE family efflux transporter [Erysipelotrichaceae bacterium OH741_COT-311]|nr:MATE family efflux transporter [Erysipelotrichaceae bacterium OH741_COT-311]
MKVKLKKFIGDKTFYITVLTVAIPLMLQQLIISSVNLIDNLMVGQLGDYAIGAVGTVNRVYIIILYGINGLVAACSIYIAQYFGAKNKGKMQESFLISLLISFLLVVCFTIVALVYPKEIVMYFTKDEQILTYGAQYLKIVIFSFLPNVFSLCIASAIRSIGKTKAPLIISIIAVIVNTILNYILIFGHFGFPSLGVKGAALATVIARFLELIMYVVVVNQEEFPRVFHFVKITKELLTKILLKAIPLFLNEIIWTFGIATLFKFYSTRGSWATSGYSIALTIADIFFILFSGMAIATTVLVSQKLGANHLEQAKENAYKLVGFGIFLALVFGIGMFASSYILPYIYNVTEETMSVAVSIVRIMGCFYWIYMATAQFYFILRAGGDMKSALLMDSGFMWLFNIPLIYMIAYYTNINIILMYVMSQMTDVIKLLYSYFLVKKEKWLVNLTVNDKEDILHGS